MTETDKSDPLAKAVIEGFSKTPKSMPSWTFYDEKGDQLFRDIMDLPEYYLTSCEAEIFRNSAGEMLKTFAANNEKFDLIELGAGDGVKTEILLKNWVNTSADFRYYPVDISPYILKTLEKRIRKNIPDLEIHSLPLTFDEALEGPIEKMDKNRKVFFFLGSNIGNLNRQQGIDFLKSLKSRMNKGDMALVGFDLRKDPRVIQKAYDDSQGVTAEFNLNLLDRLNRELGATFDRNAFSHFPYYDPVAGTAKSYIVSHKEQKITFEKLNRSYSFDAWELIHTEISRKFSPEEIEELADLAGLRPVHYFEDERSYYRNTVLM